MSTVHAVLPAGIDDPSRPSGGNLYDRRVLARLTSLGWTVEEHEQAGHWPTPDPEALARLDETLGALPDGSAVLVDGLVASAAPSVLPAACGRLRIVVLVHMPLGPESGEGDVLTAASAVVATSIWSRSRLRTWYGLRQVHVIPPGTDPAPVASGTGTGTSLLCVAAVHPGKGHDLLLEALAGLGDRRWTLACAGSLEVDPDHVSALEQQVYARRWEDRVTFCGPLTGAALEAAYAGADLVVLPSRAESYGMVVTEALAHGLPVVATRVGGVAEALGRSPAGALPGLLVPSDDVPALSDALTRWLDDSRLRERLARGAAARRPLLRGWERTAADLSVVLTQLDGRAPAGRGGSAARAQERL